MTSVRIYPSGNFIFTSGIQSNYTVYATLDGQFICSGNMYLWEDTNQHVPAMISPINGSIFIIPRLDGKRNNFKPEVDIDTKLIKNNKIETNYCSFSQSYHHPLPRTVEATAIIQLSTVYGKLNVQFTKIEL